MTVYQVNSVCTTDCIGESWRSLSSSGSIRGVSGELRGQAVSDKTVFPANLEIREKTGKEFTFSNQGIIRESDNLMTVPPSNSRPGLRMALP